MHKQFVPILIVFIFLACINLISEECTTAVIGKDASSDGKPILWKNRDSDHLINKIIYVPEQPYNYIGLINSENKTGRMVWAGLNSQGFAIMNSVAYNLPKEGEMQDLEGIIMADALRTCKTVDDFEELIRSNIGPTLGSQANFGVIDAYGGAALFEVSNKEYERLNVSEFQENYIINTNFARSGEKNKGRGYLRYDRAVEIFKNLPPKSITHNYIIQTVSRDIGNILLGNVFKNIDIENSSKWLYTNHSINRYYTSAAVIIHGVNPLKKEDIATMWVMLGEPVCTIAIPLWVEAGEIPDILTKGDIVAIAAESNRLKQILRPFSDDERKDYLDVTKLINKNGSGWLPILLKTENEILKETELFLSEKHTAQEYKNFQTRMANEALKTLKKIID